MESDLNSFEFAGVVSVLKTRVTSQLACSPLPVYSSVNLSWPGILGQT